MCARQIYIPREERLPSVEVVTDGDHAILGGHVKRLVREEKYIMYSLR